MGRFVTPQGVEIEMGDEAARVVGFKPAARKAKKSTSKKVSAPAEQSDAGDE